MSELVDRENLICYHDSVSPICVKNRIFEATTDIGLRPSQEDRFLLIPKFFREEMAFCGVFDGTVGDHASEFVVKNIVDHLCSTSEIQDPSAGILSVPSTESPSAEMVEKIRNALRQAFLAADDALITMCTDNQLHYASSTGVAAFLWSDLLTVAHVGDSKACIARVIGEEIHPEWLTVDHKPNMPHELKRIEESGGSLVWLHGNKPYIRGGDFFRRQAAGEHPKQLNYSRAFGGKDLKMFGLSAEPDISHFDIGKEDKLVLLASDGLWDVLNPRTACEIAFRARREGRSATKDIVRWAIQEMPGCNVRDNITVIAIFLNETCDIVAESGESTNAASSSMTVLTTTLSSRSAQCHDSCIENSDESPPEQKAIQEDEDGIVPSSDTLTIASRKDESQDSCEAKR